MILKIHLEYVKICVSQHICTFGIKLGTINQGGGGAKVYTFGMVSSVESKNFTSRAIPATKKVTVAKV